MKLEQLLYFALRCYYAWCVVAVTLYTGHVHVPMPSLYLYYFAVSRAFMSGAASQSGDDDSSWATSLTSGFRGLLMYTVVDVLLLVSQ